MTALYVLVPLNLILIGLYMQARLRDDHPRIRVIQPAAVIVSWLIAAAGLLEPDADRALIGVVLAGMGIAIIGDFLNIDMENLRNVLRGLVIAVFAYMTYAIGLTALNGFHPQDAIVGAVLLVGYVVVNRLIWPGVEREMRVPILIYGFVLPFAVSRAASTFFGDHFSTAQALFLSLGTLSLWVGDVEFGLHLFRRRNPLMYGPILYAGGQLLIACSVWL